MIRCRDGEVSKYFVEAPWFLSEFQNVEILFPDEIRDLGQNEAATGGKGLDKTPVLPFRRDLYSTDVRNSLKLLGEL